MARTLVNSVIIKPATTTQVGDVVQSMLTEAQFQAERDGTWVLADGRSVSGSKYETITGNANIPDLRGQFLRGLDTSGTIDPDGAGRTLGSNQADAFQGHWHKNYWQYAGGALNGGGDMLRDRQDINITPNFTTGNISVRQPVSDGVNGAPRVSQETRPKNTTVNFFIKID